MKYLYLAMAVGLFAALVATGCASRTISEPGGRTDYRQKVQTEGEVYQSTVH